YRLITSKFTYIIQHSYKLSVLNLSILTSVSLAISLIISFPSSAFRLSLIDFLFRACTYHQRDVPSCTTRHFLIGSPVLGVSTLITSAPKSANILPAKGPAIKVPNSNTRNPFNNYFDF